MTRIIATPVPERREEFLAAVKRSRKLHGYWTAPPSTPKAFDHYLARLSTPRNIGYWVLTATGELAGVINISEIIRGAAGFGYVGYYAFAPYDNQGYMTRGLGAVVSRAFRQHRLHRLEANIQPNNLASIRLVQRVGFRLEGYSPRYLKIAGRWRDHERWAITREEWLQ
jgi:[ribosomal protein S5]-alanine N-acetyltransferase